MALLHEPNSSKSSSISVYPFTSGSLLIPRPLYRHKTAFHSSHFFLLTFPPTAFSHLTHKYYIFSLLYRIAFTKAIDNSAKESSSPLAYVAKCHSAASSLPETWQSAAHVIENFSMLPTCKTMIYSPQNTATIGTEQIYPQPETIFPMTADQLTLNK